VARTASREEIETAHDIMRNYGSSMRPDQLRDLNTFINDY